MLLEDYGGQVPAHMDELLRLPGVARKTANVVIAERGQAEGIVVDTHVRRLSQRLGLTRQDDPVKIERDLVKLVLREYWNVFPHLLIWHGRRVCIARTPRCEACVLNDLCPASRVKSRRSRHTRARRLESCAGSISRSTRTRSRRSRQPGGQGRAGTLAPAAGRDRGSGRGRADGRRGRAAGVARTARRRGRARRASGAARARGRTRRVGGAAVLGRGRAHRGVRPTSSPPSSS